MSGYPYGNPSGDYSSPYGNPGGGYSSPYGMDSSGYPNYPPNNSFQPLPPMPTYGDNQSYASPYGTTTFSMPTNNSYSATPYGVSQMPGSSYGYGDGSGYPSPPSLGGQMPPPMFNQPPQQYGGQ
jgi:hypothetical protein